jgi:hypothetical protein
VSPARRRPGLDDTHEQLGTEERQRVLDDVGGVVRPDEARGCGEHRPRVELFHDPHDRHARLRVAGHHGPLHRRRPAVPGKERRMDVEKSVWWNREDRLGEYLAVGGNHGEVGSEHPHAFHERLVSEAFRLREGDAAGERQPLDRAFADSLAPAARSVRLRDDADDLVW